MCGSDGGQGQGRACHLPVPASSAHRGSVQRGHRKPGSRRSHRAKTTETEAFRTRRGQGSSSTALKALAEHVHDGATIAHSHPRTSVG